MKFQIGGRFRKDQWIFTISEKDQEDLTWCLHPGYREETTDEELVASYQFHHGLFKLPEIVFEANLLHRHDPDMYSRLPCFNAMRFAVKKGCLEVVQALIRSGGNLKPWNSSYVDPMDDLFYSRGQRNRFQIAECLLSTGSNPNFIYDYSLSSLTFAASENDIKTVKVLIEYEADINYMGNDDLTALGYACDGGYFELAGYLLGKGANPYIQWKSRDCLHLASMKGHLEIARLLINHGMFLNIPDKDGRTPSHLAAKGGHRGVLELLIETGADQTIQDKDGKTPTDF